MANLLHFEIQDLIPSAPNDWDGLFGALRAGDFIPGAGNDSVRRFFDGEGNEFRLIGDFGPSGGTVTRCLYFEDSVRTARMEYFEPQAIGSGPSALPDMIVTTWEQGYVNLIGGDRRDELTGGDLDDIMDGKAGNDGLHGMLGDDNILGKGGRDFLSGGDGDDTIKGGAGQDVLDGGAGNNRLIGGGDSDLIAVRKDSGEAHSDYLIITMENLASSDVLLIRGAFDASTPYLQVMADLDPDATSLADFDAAVLDDLGFRLKETANGSTVLNFGGGERLIFRGLGLEDIAPERIVLTDQSLKDAIGEVNALFGTGFLHDDPLF